MGEQIVRAHLEVEGKGAFSLVELRLGLASLWTMEGTAANVTLDAFDFLYPLNAETLHSMKPQSTISSFDGETLVVRADGNQYTHYGVDEVALPHLDTARGIDFETATWTTTCIVSISKVTVPAAPRRRSSSRPIRRQDKTVSSKCHSD